MPTMLEDLHDFVPGDSCKEISGLTAGKTIRSVRYEDVGMDYFIVFGFTDNTELRIRYDWIYEWGITVSESK